MPGAPTQWIDRAQSCVRQALERWNPTDLKNVEDSRKLLEQSVAALKLAIDLLRSGDAKMTIGLQPAIVALRRDISTMIRLVDACSAFRRGISFRLGGTPPAYDASGKTVGEPEGVPAHGVTG